LTTPVCQPRLTSVDHATELAAAATHDDPEVGLAAVVALRGLLDQLEALQVKAAREQGWTWERIAQALGITRQSVHKKYAVPRLRGRRS
jgi:transcriptional regulator of acetoin/glycerol metabolism